MATTVPPAPVLDLSTVVDRPFLKIDGEQFEIRHPDEFSLVQQLRQQRHAERVMALVEGMLHEPPSEATEREYAALLDQSCRQVLMAPDPIHEKLRDEHRLAIVKAFTGLLLERTRQRAGAPAPTSDPSEPNPGMSSSPDLPASTVETPSGG